MDYPCVGCVVGLTHSFIDSSIAAIRAVLINNHTAIPVPVTGPFVLLGVGWDYPIIPAGPGLG